MITLSAAVFPQQKQEKKSSCSVHVQTLPRLCPHAFNGGFDEKHRIQCGPAMQRITSEYADYDEVIEKFDWWMDWLADIYVNVLNLIHYMHDKYYYEAAEIWL